MKKPSPQEVLSTSPTSRLTGRIPQTLRFWIDKQYQKEVEKQDV